MTQKEASSSLHFRVHGHKKTDQRAIVIVNGSSVPTEYKWTFTHKKVKHAYLYRPFEEVSEVEQENSLRIKGHGLHVLVEKR